jgi:hypothetical protein
MWAVNCSSKVGDRRDRFKPPQERCDHPGKLCSSRLFNYHSLFLFFFLLFSRMVFSLSPDSWPEASASREEDTPLLSLQSETIITPTMQTDTQRKELEEMAIAEGVDDEPQVLGSTQYDRNDMDRMGKIQELKVGLLCKDDPDMNG